MDTIAGQIQAVHICSTMSNPLTALLSRTIYHIFHSCMTLLVRYSCTYLKIICLLWDTVVLIDYCDDNDAGDGGHGSDKVGDDVTGDEYDKDDGNDAEDAYDRRKASRTKDATFKNEEDAKDERVVTDVRWSGWVGFLTKGLTDEQIGR